MPTVPKTKEPQTNFGVFELLAGNHTQGSAVAGTRKQFKGRNAGKGKTNGDVLQARSEKEAEFFRKYPDKYREITHEMKGKRGVGDELGIPPAAPRPSRPPHMTDHVPSATSPTAALPGKGTDNDGKGDDSGDTGETGHNEEGDTVEEVDMDKLKAMPVRELLVWARDHNVDIKGAVKKDDILKNIESALSDNG